MVQTLSRWYKLISPSLINFVKIDFFMFSHRISITNLHLNTHLKKCTFNGNELLSAKIYMNYLNGSDKKVSLIFHLKCIQVSFFPSYSSLLTLFRHGFMNLYILVDIKMFQYVVFQTRYVDTPPPLLQFQCTIHERRSLFR